jgi:hypothetical protein
VVDPDCVADTNDNFSEALSLDLENPTVDQMCAPDDYRDFFVMDLPLGNAITGELTLYCNPEPTKLALYDESEALITEVSVSGGTATLDLGSLGVMPGKYYLRVLTQTSGEAFLYMIIPNLEIADITPNAVNVTPDGLHFDPWWVQGYGQLAIASRMDGLWIYDYSTDLYNPELLSYTETHIHQRPGLAYPYLYASDGNLPSSIDMIDLTDPSAPVIHKNIMSASDFVAAMNAEPGYLYLCTQSGPVDIYDIGTNPVAPVLVGTIPGSATVYESTIIHDATGPESWFALSIHAYYVQVYDITDKANITWFGSVSGGLTSIMWGLASVDNYLFFLQDDTPNFSMTSIHIDPGDFSYTDSVALVYEATMLDVGDGYAFPTSDTYVAKIDISDPYNLGGPASYSFSEATIVDMDVEGDHMLHALGPAGIRYVSSDIVDYGRTFGLSECSPMVVDGDYLFTIDGDGVYRAIKSVDISDPAAAFVAGDVLLDNYPSLLTVKGGRMVAFTAGASLKTIDCVDPSNMAVQANFMASANVTAMGMTDNELFLGYFDGSIEVVDLSLWPYGLPTMATIPGTDAVKAFLFKSDVMYVVAGGNILVYTISNPASPSLVDTYYPLEAARQITINGDYLYIATASYLEIADISNPMDPVFVATEPHPDAPNGEYVAAVDQFAIVQPYMTTPPTVMRVWPPDDPTVIGTLFGPEYATKPTQVLVNDGYYYERSPDFALRIWDLY